MEKQMIKNGRPQIAIIDSNTLAILGLQQILQDVFPIMEVSTFNSFEELSQNFPDSFFQ